MIDHKFIDSIPRFISDEEMKEALEQYYAIICRTPDEHPSGCTYMIISPEGERTAKFKHKDDAVLFVCLCMEKE